MVQAYAVGGIVNVAPGPIKLNNAPPANFVGELGQQAFDTSVSPPAQYIYNGRTWVSGGNAYASSSVAGIVELATDAEAQAKSSALLAVVPANLAAEGFLQWSDVTLTSAEVKALATTPIELVAAQGAGSAIQFMGAVFKLNYGGSNVFAEAGDNLGIKYTNASGVQVSSTVETTGFIDQSADTQTNAIPAQDAIVASASAENQALVLDNLGSNITGNAANDNTVSVRVYYVVQSL